jgi:hypothetical protein
MGLGSTEPLTEMSTRDLRGGRGRPERKADNLTAICEYIVWKCGSLDVSQLCGSPRHVTGIALPFFISDFRTDVEIAVQSYKKVSGIIRKYCVMNTNLNSNRYFEVWSIGPGVNRK